MFYISKGISTGQMTSQALDGEEWTFLMNYEPITLESKNYAINEDFKRNEACYFLAGTLSNNQRNDKNLQKKKLLSLDFEGLNMPLESFISQIHEVFKNVDYILYPTIHCFNKGEDKRFRYRLVLNTDRAYTKEENQVLMRAIKQRIKIPFDRASEVYSQAMGLPILTPYTSSDMIIKNKGVPLPVSALIEHAPSPAKSNTTINKNSTRLSIVTHRPGKNYTKSLLEEISEGAKEGERNVWLTSIIGKLFFIQLDGATSYEWLQVINENFVTPPLPQHELNALFNSILRKENEQLQERKRKRGEAIGINGNQA